MFQNLYTNLYSFLGIDKNGKPVFLNSIWPSRAQIQAVEKKTVIPAMFRDVYARIETGSVAWQGLHAPDGQLYPWDVSSTYIKNPPFFSGMTKVKTMNSIIIIKY